MPLVEPIPQQRIDAVGRMGATTWQKILVSLRRLADGCSYSSLDDQSRMGIESIRQSFYAFCRAVVDHYGPQYLNRIPTLLELSQIESGYASRGFSGCVGALDCMHLYWKNCPKNLKGQYHNPKSGKLATIQVEAVADVNLYCWHVFSERVGTNNDITVCEWSPLILSILNGTRPMKLGNGYALDGLIRQWYLYYLTDGIYPDWAIFVKPNHAPVNAKEKAMTQAQESCRKDVERLFGVLQGRFKILRHEFHEWQHDKLSLILNTCVIIHNMLVHYRLKGMLEDELDTDGAPLTSKQVIEEFTARNEDIAATESSTHARDWMDELLGREDSIRCRQSHLKLRKPLENHIWSKVGDI